MVVGAFSRTCGVGVGAVPWGSVTVGFSGVRFRCIIVCVCVCWIGSVDYTDRAVVLRCGWVVALGKGFGEHRALLGCGLGSVEQRQDYTVKSSMTSRKLPRIERVKAGMRRKKTMMG